MRYAPFLASFAVAAAVTGTARAQSTAGQPGAHPAYHVDAEPHLIVGVGGPFQDAGGVGVGFRATFIALQNGFVKSINNNVGIGVGADFAFGNASHAFVPVVLQWNFFVSRSWSVFGEPGVGFFTAGSSAVHPVLFAGGRYLFSDRIALVLRAGYPEIAVGVSFLF